ncbi:MAG: Hpt domain-containing protein [Lachnospiraceae bacterium]|nr:Hpt domain-containing protein [Lachnospiraceae bacterium]
MSAFLDKYVAYGGDAEGVMDRFMGDEELLETCLDQFVAGDDFEVLKGTIEKQDFNAAFECAHALKGVVGNLGITPLYNTICVLVEELRAHDYTRVDEHLADVIAKQEEFVVAYEGMK